MSELKNIKKLAVIAAAAFMSGCGSTRYIDVPDDNCYCTPTDRNGVFQNFAIIERESGDTIYQVKSDSYIAGGEIKEGILTLDTTFIGASETSFEEQVSSSSQARIGFSLDQKDQLCRKFSYKDMLNMNLKRYYYTSYELKQPGPQ